MREHSWITVRHKRNFRMAVTVMIRLQELQSRRMPTSAADPLFLCSYQIFVTNTLPSLSLRNIAVHAAAP